MNKTIGILAHVDAGKTTFAEGLLYNTNSITKIGRVDHKDSFLDSHSIEKERGITVFSEEAIINYNGSKYFLIDTPGHIDFSSEMERAIKIMDYAIIIISAVEGIESHTETVWQFLKMHRVPTFFFINKVDREGADYRAVLQEIRAEFTNDVCDITETFNGINNLNAENNMNLVHIQEEMIEFIAERDELLLEKYLEGNFDKELWLDSLKAMIKKNKIFPCCIGSALQNIGIKEFIDKLDLLTYTDYSEESEFSGRVYKIRYDNKGNRITYIKVLKGQLKVRDTLSYDANGDIITEKITGIRSYNGDKYKDIDKGNAGSIVGVLGLSKVAIGQGIGNLKDENSYEIVPTLKSKVVFDKKLNIKEVLKSFRILEEEDPSLNVTWEESLQEIQISVMGLIQLEVLKEVVKTRFDFQVKFGTPEILYKETIENEVIGYGHFEPLRHYAEVHLKIEKGHQNSGIVFENLCHTDCLTIGQQNLIKHHIYEKKHHGLLTGAPLTDVKVTLLTGRAHNKHTSGGDFRQATFRALRQGLEKANNLLLEPYYQFTIKVDIEYMGRVLNDIQKAKGEFDGPITKGNKVIIKGKAPAATFMNYSSELISFTKGKGRINIKFQGYYVCHNQEEVIEKIDYNKDSDLEYPSSSVFCSKGQAYIVPWEKAESEMHCLR